MLHKRILFAGLTAIAIFSFLNWNCTKLDTTKIGSDLLPAVDNVNTFDTILTINTTQGVFLDSTIIAKTEDYALGSITNDPLFGTTTANAFMQLKPPFLPYYWGNSKDTVTGTGVGLDSIVLCLKYKGFWGDSTLPIQLQAKEVNEPYFRDSVYLQNPTVYQPVTGATIGTASVDVRRLGEYIKFTNKRDSVNYQIRIKLDQTWAQQLFDRDSIKTNSGNNAFYSDSIYRRFYNGIAVIASGGNGLMYVNLADTATKLEVHFRRRNNGKIDSVYSSLRLNSNSFGTYPPSNAVNNIVRNRAGYPILTNSAAESHYLQTAPGTYVNLNVPGLSSLSNRIIHRAEIIVEQVPTDPILDNKLSPPNFLYLDLRDTTVDARWKPIYFDLNTTVIYDPDFKSGFPFYPGTIDFNYFGGFKRTKTDQFGNSIKYYTLNISRYVQRMLTQRTHNYEMRLYAPYNFRYKQYTPSFISFGNNIAFGRVRIGSGSNPNYPLRLRIVYSKL
jgi:hypothetical protein